MVASEPGVQCAQLYYKDLEIYKEQMLKLAKGNYDRNIKLSTNVKDNLLWWIDFLPSSYKPILRKDPDIV